MAYTWKSGGTRSPWPPPNCAHGNIVGTDFGAPAAIRRPYNDTTPGELRPLCYALVSVFHLILPINKVLIVEIQVTKIADKISHGGSLVLDMF